MAFCVAETEEEEAGSRRMREAGCGPGWRGCRNSNNFWKRGLSLRVPSFADLHTFSGSGVVY